MKSSIMFFFKPIVIFNCICLIFVYDLNTYLVLSIVGIRSVVCSIKFNILANPYLYLYFLEDDIYEYGNMNIHSRRLLFQHPYSPLP